MLKATSIRLRAVTLVFTLSLNASPFATAQQDATITRPRRVNTAPAPDANTARPDVTVPPIIAPARPPAMLERLPAEPTVRIGLAIGARSVNISTAGAALRVQQTTGADASLASLQVARVRIEPRVLAPLLTPTPVDEEQLFRVEIASVSSAAEAAEIARSVETLIGEAPAVARDDAANAWQVRVGTPAPRAEADELRARLEEAGIAAVSLVALPTTKPALPILRTSALGTAQAASINPKVSSGVRRPPRASASTASTTANGVRLASGVSNAPVRGLVVYAAGATQLLDARAPVIFSTDDENTAPLRFNEKPYRGQLEVFTNLQGALTVVNVINLEDYVRGVVPNELSPGGYPALEALKAQAVAARTYAVSHRGQFNASGFDLLPTTRSQVYGGKATEHPLATRAVVETRGLIATFHGEPINALYTSACGGRTEHAENIFGGEPVPYLRGQECAAELAHQTGTATNALQQVAPYFALQTAREPYALRDAAHFTGARDAALLTVHGYRLPTRINDEWLAGNLTNEEARELLDAAARLAHRPLNVTAPVATSPNELTRPPAFVAALVLAVDGESRADVLLDAADVDYLLAFRDAGDIPAPQRADVALLLREGHLDLYPDATLRPRQPLTRARALHTVAHLLEARGLFALQKATARPVPGGAFVVRSGKANDRPLVLATDFFLFRAFGDNLYQVRALNFVGGEPVTLHTDARGTVDYLEVRPAPNGAAAERSSPFTNWTTTLTVNEVARRLARSTGRIGAITDLRVAARGVSRRALDLEVIGVDGTAHVRGGRIRSALGLREQLFVIQRRLDDEGRLTGFTFDGRGWGHGVGMCQVGAYGLARAGWTFDQILRHYYTGIELTRLY